MIIVAAKCFSEITEICMDRHLTVDQIYQELKERYPKIGRSTVYRNVDTLVSQGQLTKLQGFGPKTYFETKQGPHAHFISRKSEKIVDIPLSHFHVSTEFLQKYTLEELDIRLYGEFK